MRRSRRPRSIWVVEAFCWVNYYKSRGKSNQSVSLCSNETLQWITLFAWPAIVVDVMRTMIDLYDTRATSYVVLLMPPPSPAIKLYLECK